MPIPHLKPIIFRVKKIGSEYKVLKGMKGPKTRRQKFLSFWLPVLVITIILMAIAGIGVFAWFSRDLPDPDRVMERSLAQSTKIYAKDEKTLLYEIYGEQKRTVINLEEIPDYMKWATIAIEDKDFYKHPGFSLKRIVKSIWVNLTRGGKVQGASTITQQFIKNAILTTEKKYSRKVRELVLAYQLERKFTKDQILKLYLNEIPYGSTTYGVESAAHTYFGKSAKDLTLAESALLAALPQAPTYYSPYGSHQDDLIARQKLVLDLMAAQGYITNEEADKAKAEDILSRIKPRAENILAPHFVMYVKEILADKYGEKMVEQGGLKVITTLNYDKQKIAEEVVTKYAQKNEKSYNAKNAALVSLDTKTGQILAMVGSRDYFDTKNDGNVNVTIRPRQPGSSFKPVVYATAFEKGYTPETILFDLVTKFKTDTKDYEPHNYDSREHGPLPMRKTLAGSLNIPAVKTLYLAGIDNVLDLAEEIGYTTFSDRSRFGLSLVLGGGEVKLLEHTSAFATFAREGLKHPVSAILRIEDKNGKVLEQFENKEQKVLDQNAAQQINDVLSDNEARSFIFGSKNYLTLPDRPVAAKTGTTNDYRDAWTLGYTPSIATGVWVGNNDNSEMKRGADGSVVAAPIWNEFMRRTVGGPVEPFHKPKPNSSEKPILQGKMGSEVMYKVDEYTNKLIPQSCLETYPTDYITEKTFKEVHDILFYVDKDNPDGPEPADPAKDPQYERWEEPVKKWAQANGYIEIKPAEESCDLRTNNQNKPEVTFVAPQNMETIKITQLNASVSVKSNRNIKYAEFFLDSKSIGQVNQAPYAITYATEGLVNGFHELKAEAHDDIENLGTATINFNYLVNGTASTLYFTSPPAAATISKTSFPYNLSVFAYDPVGTQQISFYLLGGAGESTLISSYPNPTGNNVTVAWNNTPEIGDYKIYSILTNLNGQTIQSDYIDVKVTE